MRELKFREIKFRAFDTENKTWTFVTLGDLICGACTEKGDKPLSGAKQVWEQYTGLKDKNGKEIYEGDIVVNTYYDDDEMYIVLWADDSVAFGMESLEDMELYKLPLESLEVIGNIHENPELLEKQ